MIWTNENKEYNFIVDEKIDTNKINFIDKIHENDIYEKYRIETTLCGELIICNNYREKQKFIKEIVKETYEEYLEELNNYKIEKDEWIYNIIDGLNEQEEILYENGEFIVIPNYVWNKKEIKKMHILCIVKDKNLRSIRSLDSSHIKLLESIKKETLKIINKEYNILENKIKMYIHYAPSTYHLHIHFVNIENTDVNSSVEYSHELDSIIYNLSIKDDYYKKVMNKRI